MKSMNGVAPPPLPPPIARLCPEIHGPRTPFSDYHRWTREFPSSFFFFFFLFLSLHRRVGALFFIRESETLVLNKFKIHLYFLLYFNTKFLGIRKI